MSLNIPRVRHETLSPSLFLIVILGMLFGCVIELKRYAEVMKAILPPVDLRFDVDVPGEEQSNSYLLRNEHNRCDDARGLGWLRSVKNSERTFCSLNHGVSFFHSSKQLWKSEQCGRAALAAIESVILDLRSPPGTVYFANCQKDVGGVPSDFLDRVRGIIQPPPDLSPVGKALAKERRANGGAQLNITLIGSEEEFRASKIYKECMGRWLGGDSYVSIDERDHQFLNLYHAIEEVFATRQTAMVLGKLPERYLYWWTGSGIGICDKIFSS